MRDTATAKSTPRDAGARSPSRQAQMVLPAVMVLSGIVSVQFGAGLAARLFHEVPPAAVTGLRLWTSAVAMAVISGRGLARAFGDLAKRRAWADAGIAVTFGITLLIMNFSIYQAFSRVPLGVAVTIEFLGCAGDCQWGGESVVFGIRRLLRNDGSPDRIALNKGDRQQQSSFAQQGH